MVSAQYLRGLGGSGGDLLASGPKNLGGGTKIHIRHCLLIILLEILAFQRSSVFLDYNDWPGCEH